jgi:hypothetical protein
VVFHISGVNSLTLSCYCGVAEMCITLLKLLTHVSYYCCLWYFRVDIIKGEGNVQSVLYDLGVPSLNLHFTTSEVCTLLDIEQALFFSCQSLYVFKIVTSGIFIACFTYSVVFAEFWYLQIAVNFLTTALELPGCFVKI